MKNNFWKFYPVPTMLQLLKIDLKKMTSYRTFWVVCGIYFGTLAFVTASGMEVVRYFANKLSNVVEFALNADRIPFYHFPDIWQNLFWTSGLFKILLGTMVVISITNEYTYRTVRQNIIDGLSRWQFLETKILTNILLSLMSVVMVLIIALVTGLIYSTDIEFLDVLAGFEFAPAYFLEVFAFLSWALLLGILIQRSGLTIILLMLSYFLEWLLLKKTVPDGNVLWALAPMQSISNLVHVPWLRYILQEIQDYVKFTEVAIVCVWIVLFNYFSYLKLQKSDI